MRSGLFLGVAGLVVGVAVGYWLRGSEQGAKPEPAVSVPTPVASTAVPATAAKQAGTDAMPARAEGTTDAAPREGATLKLLRLLAGMRRAGALSFDVRLLEHGGHLSKSAKALFRITDAEAAQLDAAFDAVNAQRGQIEAERATMRRDEPSGAVVIALPTYPEAGGKIYDGLMKRLGETLGAERFEVMQSVCASELDRSFGEMGLEPRTLIIGHKTFQDGQVFITLHDERKSEPTVDAAGRVTYTSSSSSEGTFRTRAELVKHLGPVADKLVPAGF